MITNKPRMMQSNRTGIFKRLLINTMLLMLSPMFAIAQQSDTQEWRVVKSKWGIEIATRPHANGYKYVRAKTKVHGSQTDFVKLLDNIEIGPDWIANCKKVELIASEGQSVRVVHTYFKAPWPVKDRDMVTRSNTVIDEHTGDITITVVDYGQNVAAADKHVRMEAVHGTWSLRTLTENEYELMYEGYGEPAGKIPLWLANQILVSSTFDTFVGIKKQLNLVSP